MRQVAPHYRTTTRNGQPGKSVKVEKGCIQDRTEPPWSRLSNRQIWSTDTDMQITPIIYLDESMEGNLHILSALAMPVSSWKLNLDALISARRDLKGRHGAFTSKEFHTSEFLGGRGRYSNRFLSREERAQIYREMLQRGTQLSDVALFNTVSTKKMVDRAFERLLNRFQRNLDGLNGHFFLASDAGQEYLYPKITRRLRRYNPIPNRWGQGFENVPISRLVEDPIFIRSDVSYFIQLVDMIAYAVLRKEQPHPSGSDLYGIGTVFEEILGEICVHQANYQDPYGIIRVK